MSFVAALAAIGIEGIAGTIGAGALMGAGIGAGTSAITGGDPAQGALMGGITGGIGGGISSGLGALAPAGGFGSDIASGMGGIEPTVEGTAGMGGFSNTVSSGASAPNAFSGLGSDTLNSLNAGDTALMANAPAPAIGTSAPLSTTEKIGSWAAEHPTITGGIGALAATPFVNSAFTPSIPTNATGPKYSTPLHWAGAAPGTFSQASFAPDIPNPADYYPTTRGYAEGGGVLSSLPGSDLLKAIYDSSIGNVIAPELSDALFKPGDSSATDLSNLTPEQIQQLKMQLAGGPQPGTVPSTPAPKSYAQGGIAVLAEGGIANLGSYRSGGSPNLLHGPGDGVSDDIPANIAGKQPARLATGEYVVSARIVSELGNGSTDAGAKRLDEMVKRIQSDRRKTTGKNKEYANDTKAYKHLPA